MGDLMDTLLYTASFRHVTVVFDACSTQPYGTHGHRETVTTSNLQLDSATPNPSTGVALCSASGQLELAQEASMDGKGVSSLRRSSRRPRTSRTTHRVRG